MAQIKTVTGKRPLAVINHILKHGKVTTEELREHYGYEHPPRARMDVLECGIPLETVRVSNRAGTKKIAAYRFGNPTQVARCKTGGRQPFSKAFKKALYDRQGGKCAITGECLEGRYLSVDHRVPFQVAGDQRGKELDPDDFMLIGIGLQRVKSWSCEHCRNGTTIKDPTICCGCFWAHPEEYTHIAMEQRRRVDIVWVGEEIREHDILMGLSKSMGISLADYIKRMMRSRTD